MRAPHRFAIVSPSQALLGVIGSWVPELAPVPEGSSGPIENADLVRPRQTVAFDILGEQRMDHWAVPAGPSPAHGWPVVMPFQGSVIGAQLTWQASKATPFGADDPTQRVECLIHGASPWDTSDLLVSDHEWIAAAPDEVVSWFPSHPGTQPRSSHQHRCGRS